MRVLETHLYAPERYPFDLIAPVSIIWKPLQSDLLPTKDPSRQTSPGKGKKKEKGKENGDKEGIQEPSGSLPVAEISRTVWIRVHPAAFSEVFAALRNAASLTLDAVSRNSKENRPSEDIELADLRGQLNVFEIMGPKSNQVLKGALSPIGNDKRDDFKKVKPSFASCYRSKRACLQFWQSLGDLQTSSSVPRGMVVGLKVYDPRLKYVLLSEMNDVDASYMPSRFPPSIAKIQLEAGSTVPVAFSVTPTPLLAASEIWEENSREGLRKPRYKKKDLDERRSKVRCATVMVFLRLILFVASNSWDSSISLTPGRSHTDNSDSAFPRGKFCFR
jgi:ribonuclease P/MRP protein subunit POP1